MSTETLVENKLSSISALKTGNEVDLVRSYLRDIGRVPLLTHEQDYSWQASSRTDAGRKT